MNWRSPDFWIVVSYLGIMLGIALYYRRFAEASLENYFLAGRRVPGWLNGVSYSAALISPDAATGYGGLAVVTGTFVCWWYLSRFGFALFVGAVLFAVFWRRLQLFTSLEFYDIRFPKRAATTMRAWIAVRTSLIALPAWTGITLLASCKILGPALGFSREQTLLLVVPVSFLYVFLSGYKGVVVSNLIQMIIFFAGTLTLALLTLSHFGGPAGLADALGKTLGDRTPEMLKALPPWDHPVFPLVAALAWFFGQTIGYGGDTAPMSGPMEGQRILSTRTEREAVTMYVVTAGTMFVLLLLVSLPCLGAVVLWPELRESGADRELAYGRLLKHMLPTGALGLVIAAMLAGAMSTVSDNLNFGSQVLVHDLYRRYFRPAETEAHYFIVGRACMLLILGLALAVVYNARLLFEVAVFMLQLSCAELPANWAQWWWWRFNGKARIAASLGGALIFVAVVLGPRLLEWFGVPGAAHWILPWWWQTFLVMALTSALWISVTLCTRSDSPDLLRAFYQRAQPLGWWGPFAASTTRSLGTLTILTRGFGFALLGTASSSAIVVAVSQFYVGRYPQASVLLAIGAAGLFLFLKYITSFLNVLDRTEPARDELLPPQPRSTKPT